MKILKWGFIGCGEVTEIKSGPAFNEIEGSSIYAVMSRHEQRHLCGHTAFQSCYLCYHGDACRKTCVCREAFSRLV